jgi:hypothetical protein
MPTWNPTSGNNYSVGANWGGTAPTSTTDAVFDGSASNANCTINISGLNCLRFRVINGYTGTITFNANLNVYGNYEVDSASATSWAFSAAANLGLLFRANASIDIPTTIVTSNIGMSILTSGVSITLTLVRDTTIANFIATSNGPNTNVSFIINRTSAGNGDNLFVRGNFTHNALTGTGFFGGTTTINFTSSTTSTITIGSQGVRNNMVINGTGTFTGTIGLGTGNTTTWTSGNTTGLSVSPLGASTIISNGTTWNNISFGTNTDRTLTITTDLVCGGVLSAFSSYGWTIVHTGGSVIRIRGTGANNMNIANATVIVEPAVPCTVSLSNQNTNMNLTFNPFPGGQITWTGGTFIGNSNFFTYLTSNGGPTPLATGTLGLGATSGALTINTSPSPSNYIVFPSYTASNGTLIIALLSDLHINGTVSFSVVNQTINGVGYSLICGGCTSSAAGYNIGGTANIQLSYTGTWNTAISIGNDLIISPFAGQTVTISALTKSVTNKSITYTPNAGILNSSASALTIASGGINVPMSTSGMTWGSITVGAGSALTLNQTLNVSGSLLCSGNATFAGTHGFTTNGFTCITASAVITLQNANATYGSPLAAYNVTGPLILQGGSTTTRVTLQASGRANFTGSIATASLPATSVMTVASLTSGTIQAGMTVSQAFNIIPTGLQPFINDRPVITTGSGLSWTLNKALSTVVPSPSGTTTLAAGFKAIFNLTSTGTNVNVGLVTTQDIDSSGGQTILAALSNGDDTATNTALYRTLNWGPLIAPSGSVYYTWVD